jgi:hypothetical protein
VDLVVAAESIDTIDIIVRANQCIITLAWYISISLGQKFGRVKIFIAGRIFCYN